MTLPRVPMAVLVLALLVFIGSFGPWAVADEFGISAGGTDGDGSITLVLALIAAAPAAWKLFRGGARRWVTWVSAVAFALAAIIGIIDLIDINNLDEEAQAADISLSPGWGLIVVLIGSLAGAAVTAYVLFGNRLKKR